MRVLSLYFQANSVSERLTQCSGAKGEKYQMSVNLNAANGVQQFFFVFVFFVHWETRVRHEWSTCALVHHSFETLGSTRASPSWCWLRELRAELSVTRQSTKKGEIKRQCERSRPSVEQESYSRDAIMGGDASVSWAQKKKQKKKRQRQLKKNNINKNKGHTVCSITSFLHKRYQHTHAWNCAGTHIYTHAQLQKKK